MNSSFRKIHNLCTSGAVTVTGPNQPRILKTKVGNSTNNIVGKMNHCYVCDDAINVGQQLHILSDLQTSHTHTKFPNKIGQLVGEAFMVIVSVDDVVCTRCTNLMNYLDRLENDVDRVRTNLLNLLIKKYSLNDDSGVNNSNSASPPLKMQKLNSGSVGTRILDATDSTTELNRVRKLINAGNDTLGAVTIGKASSASVSAVQQIKIGSQAGTLSGVQGTTVTPTLTRKTTKIYKCLTCDYKTSDMRLFNTHYETCKNQNFQCKNCKRIFPNFGTMKHHMVREHNTSMDHTCAVCHINFVNEPALRKHMESNHSTNVVVTSTTTIPAGAGLAGVAQSASESSIAIANTVQQPQQPQQSHALYTCNHCQFKSIDKVMFDEHVRKHLQRPRPFKCRVCSQRFETREAATVHAKQHQPNYFKCGTCSLSFPKRELLVKHFEVHRNQSQVGTTAAAQQHANVQATITTTQVKQTPAAQQIHVAAAEPSQNIFTTQKLLQESIDEALSDNVATPPTPTSSNDGGTQSSASNIRFFSCHICSLTFIQENYYTQHMLTHRPEKKMNNNTETSGICTSTHVSHHTSGSGTLNAVAAALLTNDEHKSEIDMQESNGNTTAISESDIESIFEKMHSEKSDPSSAENEAATGSRANSVSSPNNINQTGVNENLAITSQVGSEGITFNITIPQTAETSDDKTKTLSDRGKTPVAVSIDMPMLDHPEDKSTLSHKGDDDKDDAAEQAGNDGETQEADSAQNSGNSIPVSMPSLDDDQDHEREQEEAHADSNEADAHEIKTEKADSTGKDSPKSVDRVKEEIDVKSENIKVESLHDDASIDNSQGGHSNAEAEAEDEGSVDHGEAEDQHSGENVAVGEGGGETEADGEEDEGTASGGEHHVAMELDEAMQAQVESGQIKFILNENGQLLQLDNHIITDAEGNQILVQDPEQIQQLLQSVGVLQSGEGLDGETLQMMTDANGQMVLVQGENNETQLIDASLLNAEGQLVLQQGQDGELGEGAHVISEDGTRIPVSVSYTADGQPIVQVQQQVLEAAAEEHEHHALEKNVTTSGNDNSDAQAVDTEENNESETGNGGTNASGNSGLFALDALMQQALESKSAE